MSNKNFMGLCKKSILGLIFYLTDASKDALDAMRRQADQASRVPPTGSTENDGGKNIVSFDHSTAGLLSLIRSPEQVTFASNLHRDERMHKPICIILSESESFLLLQERKDFLR
jgi:hypothetical protein